MGIGRRITNNDTGDTKISVVDQSKPNASPKLIEFVPQEPKYDLEDIIIPRSIKSKLLDVAEYTTNSNIVFENWGLKNTHTLEKRMGINFYGPPGTGKTMAAHSIAKYLGRKILVVNYADIESKYVGETPKNICRAFEAAKESNSIIFFDEADAILSRRVTNMNNATDVSVNQTRSVLLMVLNDYQDFVIFATNFIENFDPAFMRRISMHIKFDLPDEECRKLLWRKYIPSEMPLYLNIDAIATKYNDLSGSDISTAVLNTAFRAARERINVIPEQYLYDAVEDILLSKRSNSKNNVSVTKKVVSEEYVQEQIKSGNAKIIENKTEEL